MNSCCSSSKSLSRLKAVTRWRHMLRLQACDYGPGRRGWCFASYIRPTRFVACVVGR